MIVPSSEHNVPIQAEAQEPCPKCGSDKGFAGPTYKTDYLPGVPRAGIMPVYLTWLAFTCVVCRYERRVKPLDDRAESQAEPDQYEAVSVKRHVIAIALMVSIIALSLLWGAA